MKRLLIHPKVWTSGLVINTLFGVLVSIPFVSNAQFYTSEIICRDSLIQRDYPKKSYFIGKDGQPYRNNDSIVTYYIKKCLVQSKFALRFETGISKYYFDSKTSDWLGNFIGPNFNLFLSYNNISLGVRFKPATIDPEKELTFNSITLPNYAKLNPIKFDYLIGYIFPFRQRFSIEPTIGYSRSSFVVINEKELGEKFSINSTGGVILGLAINKYYKFKYFSNFAIFISSNFCFVDYSIVNKQLGQNYLELNFGVAFKDFWSKRITKRLSQI